MSAQQRFDFDAIAGWVGRGERVLDLGCGDGSLLAHLRDVKGAQGYGVEIDPERVLACIENGINVIQIDLERGLYGFDDQSFSHVIISQALQSIHRTERILTEMLRVGREAVVSFPNFAYRDNRAAIARGRMPVSARLPYQWYETPNVRFFTIADFEALCGKLGIELRERVAFDDDGNPVAEDPNLNASLALYRLGRP
jgi:methionine biosynthesis protein MetW